MAPPRKSGRRGSSVQSRLSLIHLEIDSGPGRGERMEILEGQTTIGRADDCNFQIDSDAASRLHATVFREGDTVVIRDENSHNGTFVNEVEIDEDTQLLAGDKIQVGDSVLCLVINGSRKRELPSGSAQSQHRGLFLKNVIGFVAAMAICTSLLVFVLTRLGGEALSPDEVVPQPALPEAPAAAPQTSESTGASLVQSTAPAEAPSAPAAAQTPSAAPSQPVPAAQPAAPAAAPAPPPAPPSKPLPPPVSAASVYRQSDTQLPSRRPSAESRPAGGKVNKAKEERRARSLYAQGDIQGALDLAESIGASSLAGRISSFQKAEGAARAAFSFKKGTEAIQHYEEAFGIDEDIMSALKGEAASVPGRRVARELSQLYQKAGEAFFKKHDNERAAMFFERSLEYDSSNAASRTFLKKFGRDTAAE